MVDSDSNSRHPFLASLGERVRMLRARRGMTRRAVAQAAQVSERHLANLEAGSGNASVLILLQVAQALNCSIVELLGDVTTSSPEWLLIRELLGGRNEAQLQRVRTSIADMFAEHGDETARFCRIALVGLRGAGKSTLGKRLAEDLDWPFVELSREIEKYAGCNITEIHSLYGANAYRRYEKRALEETVHAYKKVVIATPGGLVSEAATFNETLSQCFTVWLKALPEDHLGRVAAQGDMRPMAASTEALEDLKRILDGRSAFYAKADMVFDTSAHPLEESFVEFRRQIRDVLKLPV
jgi:XRE family transcriptional regulator, aerobic/anaerobic benzoate catabolism transcriptional regulator